MDDSSMLSEAIAVVGMSGRFPGANSVDELWELLKAGREGLSTLSEMDLRESQVPETYWRNPNYIKRGGFLTGIDQFDADCFGYSGRQALLLDPQHRLFLECVAEALESAGQQEPGRNKIGLFAGSTQSDYAVHLRTDPSTDPASLFEARMSVDKDFLTTRASYKLNLTGPSIAIQTACSTSLVAVHMACQSLLNFESDVALAGGVAIRVPHRAGYLYQEGGILSPDGHCRAFDAQANGTVPGAGVGVVVLMRLQDALDEGAQIHAVIRGSAINNDGATKAGFTAPGVRGQSEVIASALAAAGIEASSVGMIEAHGTGTSVGDAIEITALNDVFQTDDQPARFCALGSIKTNIGHLDAAAGVAGLIKAVLCVKHGGHVPNANHSKMAASLAGPNCAFFVPREFQPWPKTSAPRRAGVSSFGIGGTNSHVIVEEPPSYQAPRPAKNVDYLVPISGRSADTCKEFTQSLLKYLEGNPQVRIEDVAFTLAVGRRHGSHRAHVVSKSIQDLLEKLRGDVAPGLVETTDAGERPTIFLFSGQGENWAGCARGLYETDPGFLEDLESCSSLFRRLGDIDISGLVRPEADCRDGVATQPAIFAIQYCLARLWIKWGLSPAAVMGHSLGEFAASCISGRLELEDAVRLLVIRAREVEAAPSGAMLAVALSAAEVSEVISGRLSLAAVNAPGQCVLSGPEDDISCLIGELKNRKIACTRLPSSRAFHSWMMREPAKALDAACNAIAFRNPKVPYMSCVTGDWYTASASDERAYWGRHLCEPVLFRQALDAILRVHKKPILLEIGSGETLRRLVLQHDAKKSGARCFVSMSRGMASTRANLLETLGEVWKSGASVDFRSLYPSGQHQRLSLPTGSFMRKSYWPSTHSLEQKVAESGQVGSLPREQWFYTPSWRRSSPPPMVQRNSAKAGHWLVFADTDGVGDQLAESIEKLGRTAIIVREGRKYQRRSENSYTISPALDEDCHSLMLSLSERQIQPEGIAYCWSLTTTNQRGSLESSSHDEVAKVLKLVTAISANSAHRTWSIVMVTNCLYRISDSDQVLHDKSAIRSVGLAVNQEIPQIRCSIRELPCFEHSADEKARRPAYIGWIASELIDSADEFLVSYRRGKRWLPAYDQIPWKASWSTSDRLVNGGVYILIGGLGRVGLSIGRHLASEYKATLIFVTRRSEFPERGRWATYAQDVAGDERTRNEIRALMEMESSGGTVLVHGGDVSDKDRMNDILDLVEQRFREINGVFHLAAVTSHRSSHRPVLSVELEDFAAQMRPKVQGISVLRQVLAHRKHDFVVLFSSNASILGGIGSSAYAAANASVDSHASTEDGMSKWRSINWDTWMTGDWNIETLKNVNSEVSRAALTEDEAVAALKTALSISGLTQIVVSKVNLADRVTRWVDGKHSGPLTSDTNQAAGKSTRERPMAPPRSELERDILGIWVDVLDIQEIGVEDDFFELGGDSLVALRMLARVREMYGIELSMKSVFRESRTVSALSVEILAELMRENDSGIMEEELLAAEKMSAEHKTSAVIGR